MLRAARAADTPEVRPRTIAPAAAAPAARTRKLLLAAAREAFAAGGYNRVTIDQVAERAGFTKGAFYVHFPDKASALLAVFEEWAEEISGRLRQLARAVHDGASLPDALATFLEEGVADLRSAGLELELRSQAARLAGLQAEFEAAAARWDRNLRTVCGGPLAAEILELRAGLTAAAVVHGPPGPDAIGALISGLLAPRALTAARRPR